MSIDMPYSRPALTGNEGHEDIEFLIVMVDGDKTSEEAAKWIEKEDKGNF